MAMLLLGPERFFGLAHQVGRAVGEFKRAAAGIQAQIAEEVRPTGQEDSMEVAEATNDAEAEERTRRTMAGTAPAEVQLRAPREAKSTLELKLRSSVLPVCAADASPKASFWAHVEELRRRFLYSLMALGVGFGVCWYFAGRIFDFMQKPIVETLRRYHFDRQLVYLNPTEPFNLYLRIGLSAGFLLACPFVLYQLWLFVSPGLYRHEKRLVVPFVLSTVALLFVGAWFGYKIVYPAALNFLIGYGAQFRPAVTVGEYTDLFLTTILGLGLVFELPVLMGFLGRVGIVSAGGLWRNLRYSILVIFILAGIITPTADVLNMCVFAAPMLGLYLLSIAVVWAVDPKRGKTADLRRSAA